MSPRIADALDAASPAFDVLDDVLATLQIRGVAVVRSERVAPFTMTSWTQAQLQAHFADGEPDSRVVMLEAVVEGEVILTDHTGADWAAGPGDIVLFAGGQQHRMRQGDAQAPTDIGSTPSPSPWTVLGADGASPTAVWVCGIFVLRDTPLNPLVEALPDVLVLDRGSRTAAMYPFLMSGFAGPTPGRNALLDRAAEMLFILAIQEVAMSATCPRWFGAIRDVHVGRAIQAIHQDPGADASIEQLATVAGVSRSGLTARFRATLGLSPGRYRARWRMNLAARLLKDRSLGLAEVAERVGYANEFAFSRAFKRQLGVAPSVWRKRRTGD